MSENHHRLHPLGAGFRRIWTELEIQQGRHINAATLAREATNAAGAPVQPRAPMAIVMGRDTYSPPELVRLLNYFGVELEDVELIGKKETGWLP